MISLLVALLIWLLIFGLVCWLVYFVITRLPIPAPFAQVALAVLGVVALIILIEHLLPLLAGVH